MSCIGPCGIRFVIQKAELGFIIVPGTTQSGCYASSMALLHPQQQTPPADTHLSIDGHTAMAPESSV